MRSMVEGARPDGSAPAARRHVRETIKLRAARAPSTTCGGPLPRFAGEDPRSTAHGGGKVFGGRSRLAIHSMRCGRAPSVSMNSFTAANALSNGTYSPMGMGSS